MRPWYLGNTTVRSPFRLRDGLIALANSPLRGRIKGRENEIAFAWVLHNSGVANIVRPDADVSDLGRKWRGGFKPLGVFFSDIPALHCPVPAVYRCLPQLFAAGLGLCAQTPQATSIRILLRLPSCYNAEDT